MATTVLAGGAQVASALDTPPCSGAVAAPPAAMQDGRSASQVVRVPESIPSDGSVDVAPQLQQWIQSVPSGPDADHPTVIEFRPGGCYRVDDTLTLGLRSSSGPAGLHWPELPFFKLDNVRLDLRGSVLFQGDATPWSPRTVSEPAQQPRRKYGNPIVFLPGVSGVSIVNGTLRSTNTAAAYQPKVREAWACIWVAGARPGEPAPSRVEISGMHLTNCWGDGVYVTGMTTRGLEVKGLEILGNTISGTGRHGVTVQGASDVLVQGNEIRRIPRFVFDAEPSAAMGIAGLRWSENTGSSGHLGYAQYGGAARAAGAHLTFDGNTIDEGVWRFRFGGGSTSRRGLVIRGNRNVGVDRFERKPNLLGRHIVLVGGNWAEVEVTDNRQSVLEGTAATCAVN
ncbi:MAG: right-handed parallel beta-helix repeat-containing protein, partial [Actinomycetes bacterium]